MRTSNTSPNKKAIFPMNQNELKKAAAERSVSFVQEGRVLGVGTGSTVDFFIDALAASGKKVPACVSSSVRSTEHLERLRSPFFRSLVSLNNATAVTSAPEFSSWTVPMRSIPASTW